MRDVRVRDEAIVLVLTKKEAKSLLLALSYSYVKSSKAVKSVIAKTERELDI